MATVLGAVGNTVDKLKQEQTRIQAIADGEKPGIVSVQYSQDTIDKLNQEVEKANKEVKKNSSYAGPVSMLSYTVAAHRDAQYCCRGRKFMRIAGLNARAQAVFGRIIGIACAEQYKNV